MITNASPSSSFVNITASKVAILGAGSWGLTLAWLLASTSESTPPFQPKQVTLWTRSAQKAEALNQNRNVNFPVSVTLPESVVITSNLTQAITHADAVLLVVTSQATKAMAEALVATGCLPSHAVVINASKGLDAETLEPLSVSLEKTLPPGQKIAVLSGPTLAKEILNGLPTACSLACNDPATAERLQGILTCHKRFRLYTNTDVLGVELGGALKNVFAIASGFMAAKQLGDNARAALITRGLAEMTRLGAHLGADPQTLYGLSGLGDLLATCYSPLSRNYQVGYRLGQGEPLGIILEGLHEVAEGVPTSYAVARLGDELGLDTPIVDLVVSFLEGHCVSDEQMIQNLMSRKLKAESMV